MQIFPLLSQRITEWEANEEWEQALRAYNKSLQEEQTAEQLFTLNIGKVNCLKNLGYYPQLLDAAKALLIRTYFINPHIK